MLDIEWSLYYKSINIYDKHRKGHKNDCFYDNKSNNMIALVYKTLNYHWTQSLYPTLTLWHSPSPTLWFKPEMKTFFAIFLSMNSHIPCHFLLIWLPVHVLNLFILSLSIQTSTPRLPSSFTWTTIILS